MRKGGRAAGAEPFWEGRAGAEAVQAERSVFERLKRVRCQAAEMPAEMPCVSLRNAIKGGRNSHAFPVLNFTQRFRTSIQ